MIPANFYRLASISPNIQTAPSMMGQASSFNQDDTFESSTTKFGVKRPNSPYRNNGEHGYTIRQGKRKGTFVKTDRSISPHSSDDDNTKIEKIKSLNRAKGKLKNRSIDGAQKQKERSSARHRKIQDHERPGKKDRDREYQRNKWRTKRVEGQIESEPGYVPPPELDPSEAAPLLTSTLNKIEPLKQYKDLPGLDIQTVQKALGNFRRSKSSNSQADSSTEGAGSAFKHLNLQTPQNQEQADQLAAQGRQYLAIANNWQDRPPVERFIVDRKKAQNPQRTWFSQNIYSDSTTSPSWRPSSPIERPGTPNDWSYDQQRGAGWYNDNIGNVHYRDTQTQHFIPYRVPSPELGLQGRRDGTYSMNDGSGRILRRANDPHGTMQQYPEDQPGYLPDVSYTDRHGKTRR
jgi:hypothetical protein